MFAPEIETGIEKLIIGLNTDNGGTVSMTGDYVPTTGYMVGGYVDSLIFDSMYLESDHIPYEMIVRFVVTHFKLATTDSMFVGAWLDKETDQVYIDLSQRFTDRAVAIHAAIDNDEIAIWDLEKGEEIRVS